MKKNQRSLDEPRFHVILLYGTLWWAGLIASAWILVRIFGPAPVLTVAACGALAAMAIWRLSIALARWLDHYEEFEIAAEEGRSESLRDFCLMARIMLVLALFVAIGLVLVALSALKRLALAALSLAAYQAFRRDPEPSASASDSPAPD